MFYFTIKVFKTEGKDSVSTLFCENGCHKWYFTSRDKIPFNVTRTKQILVDPRLWCPGDQHDINKHVHH